MAIRNPPSHPTPEAGVIDILLDGHVHFHGCFDREGFFDSALANLCAGATAAGPPGRAVLCLLLTEGADEDFFEALSADRRIPGKGAWTVDPSGEDGSLLVSRRGTDSLILVAGRQIVTREGLEVLAIGRRARYPRGLAVRDAIEATLAQQAIPVIPWGFGKWWFARGQLLDALLHAPETPRLFLGDNAGRPQIAPAPRLFSVARERGFFVLPGSDPLPFPAQVRTVGRFGFALRGAWDATRPAESVKRLLAELSSQPRTFGRRESLAGFARSQVGMQLRKWTRA